MAGTERRGVWRRRKAPNELLEKAEKEGRDQIVSLILINDKEI